MTDLLSIADLPEGAVAEILALSERIDLGPGYIKENSVTS